MTTLREAAQRALNTFESMGHEDSIFAGEFDNEITTLRTALQTPPPQAVTLTDEEIAAISTECAASAYRWSDFEFARAVIEAYQRKQEGKV